jgi:hypothetical protein
MSKVRLVKVNFGSVVAIAWAESFMFGRWGKAILI